MKIGALKEKITIISMHFFETTNEAKRRYKLQSGREREARGIMFYVEDIGR